MSLNKNSLKALREFYEMILAIDIEIHQKHLSDKDKEALLQHQLKKKFLPQQIPFYDSDIDVKLSVLEDSADGLKLKERRETMQDLFDFLITSKEHLLTIISPDGIKEPITDFQKFHLEIALLINNTESNNLQIKRPNNYGKIISRVIGIAIKSTAKQIGERKNDFPSFKLLNELAQLFTDDGTISPENEGKITEYAEKLAYLLSRNQYKSEKNAKVPYEINKQKFKKFCSQILYAAIANYKNDTTPQQQNHLTPTYNFSVNSLYSPSEQEVLSVMQACYNERTRKVIGLPIWPCHNLISSIILLPDTTLKAPEKRRIKTDLETGFKSFIKDNNFPTLFYYLDEEERTIYQIATIICQKLPKTIGERCTISIVLPSANECQAQELTKLELTEEIGNILKDCTAFLNTANELIAEDNQKETFEELKLEIKENIKKIKTILEGHGIYSQNIKPQPSKERVKTKSVQN